MTSIADLAKMGKPLRDATGAQRVQVDLDGEMWVRCSESDYYTREDKLRSTARLRGAKMEAWLLFEKGKQRL